MLTLGMIETWSQCLQFIQDSMKDDLFMHVIPVHHGVHSAINSPSILFIKNLRTKQVYYYGFDHPDIRKPKPVDDKQFVNGLDKMTGVKWVFDKKSFFHLVPLKFLHDVGLAEYMVSAKVVESDEYNTTAHNLVLRNFPSKSGYGKFVPLMKHLEAFTELSESAERIIKKAPLDAGYLEYNVQIIEPLAEMEKHGVAVDETEFRKHWNDVPIARGFVYSQYNFYTATGRPSNRFGGLNYAAIHKDDGSRKSFVSRYGQNGGLVLIDYSAFHPRIIAKLTNYPLDAKTDIYEYLARLYFEKEKPDELDIAEAKKITFRQHYGGIEKKYQHIKYLSHSKEFIDYHWRFFNEHGYVETPIFKRRITNKHLQSPNPSKVLNYILQATEGEIAIPVLGAVNSLLRGKKTKPILYTYDSILFDYCYDDGIIMHEVQKLMSMNWTLPTKCYVGSNYHEMEEVSFF